MASQKKVILRQLDGTLWWGYLPATGVLVGADVHLLDASGRVQPVRLNLVKTVAYVNEFNLRDASDPERFGRRTFSHRPKALGLWLKLLFTDGDVLEGLSPFDVGFIDSLTHDRCIAITPPDPKSNAYRVLVPRAAMENIEAVGLITPLVKRRTKPAEANLQAGLFGNS